MSSAFASASKRESPAFRTREQQRESGFGSSATKAFGSYSSNAERSGFASGAFSSRSRPVAGHSGGHTGGHGFGPSTRAKEAAPIPVVATSYTDFPSLALKKATVAVAAPSKPAMNFKDVAKAAASKPAPTPACLSAPKPATAAAAYYRDEWGYDEDEDVDLEITDEDGGLNSRRAGDKSNW